MITFNTLQESKVDPVTDQIMDSNQEVFQDLDSKVFLNLVLNGRNVSVENFCKEKTVGYGLSEGFGYQGSGYGIGVSVGSGWIQQNISSGEGCEKFSFPFGLSFGEGDGEGYGNFPLFEFDEPSLSLFLEDYITITGDINLNELYFSIS